MERVVNLEGTEGGGSGNMRDFSVLAENPQGTFKETELGLLPDNWTVSSIAESCYRPEYGYTASAEKEPVGPRFLRISDIQERGVDWETVPHCRCDEDAKRKHRLRPGDLLFARIGATTGKSFLVRSCPEAIYASYLIRIKTKEIDPDFLYYFCNSEMYWKQINANKADKLKGGVSGSVLAQVKHCLPPPREQRAIVTVLSKIQAAVEVQEKIVATLKELKAATMAKLFREGLRGEPLKQTEIGEVPESWEIVRVGDIFTVELGKMLSPKARQGLNPRPYLRNKNVQWGRFDIEEVFQMDFSDQEFERFRLRPGDVLVCEGGEPGRAAVWNGEIEDYCYQKALHRLRPHGRRSVLPQYYVYWTTAALTIFRTYKPTGTKTTIAHLPKEKLEVMEIALPDPAEQVKIVGILEGLDRRILHAEKRLKTFRSIFSSVLHVLMTGQVRVMNLPSPERIILAK
jgi:type I restriction enzyme S subunit